MSFYSRKIPYYKSFRVIDTDGDGVKDTLVYKPYSNFYYIQFGMEQTIKNIGHYNMGVDDDFEVVSFDGIWDESNDGLGDNNPDTVPPLGGLTGDTLGSDLQQDATVFCNDPEAINYNPALIGNASFQPCEDNSCCDYLNATDYSSGTDNSQFAGVECLPLYTDWGPWNDNLLLNDTSQIYVTNTDCALTLRMINENADLLSSPFASIGTLVDGGWYGASIKIEVDSGLGFETVTPGSPLLLDMETTSSGYSDIFYDTVKETFTLGEKVKMWAIESGQNNLKNYYVTRPFRDITIKASADAQIKITYYNGPSTISDALYKNLRLQLIKGTKFIPKPFNPSKNTPITFGVNEWEWIQSVTTFPIMDAFLGSISDRHDEGETFHFVVKDNSLFTNPDYNSIMRDYWKYYLLGYGTWTSQPIPWGATNTMVPAGDFYTNPNVSVLNDFGDNTSKSIIVDATDNSLNPITNPSEVIIDFTYNCDSTNNYVSYFDKDGDGFIEYDQNYPIVDSLNPGSVDIGLFSKTRYDSPYVYLPPGANGGGEALSPNDLITNLSSQSTIPTGTLSSAGWRQYAYIGPSSPSLYEFKNVSPTCQLGGCDNILNANPNLVDESNSNIFLPQTDEAVGYPVASCANIYDGNVAGTATTITHLWNYGNTDAKGGCCAKRYDTSLNMSQDGPWLESKCSRCHKQMTTRSAQPIFDNNTKIQMQTTDSDVYYGPFYDPTNPTYNGYGLAFSRANKFCRDVKNKNGVKIKYSVMGTPEQELFIGGIIHGGGVQATPTTDINANYGVTPSTTGSYDIAGYQTGGITGCVTETKLPLRCQIVTNDPNCPNGTTCMKCIYCFKCSSEEKQPGVFTGNNAPTDGPSDGVDEVNG